MESFRDKEMEVSLGGIQLQGRPLNMSVIRKDN